MRMNVDVSDSTYIEFRDLVGKGNISQVLRTYIESRLENKASYNEKQLRTKFLKAEKEYESIKTRLLTVESERKGKEEEERKKKQEFMKGQAELIEKAKRKLGHEILERSI